MFKLASLFVDIKAKDDALKGTLAETKTSLSAWGVAAGSAVGTLAGQAIAAAGSSIAGFFASGIKGAVDLKETMSKVDAIFGSSAGKITAQADEMAAKYGVVKQSFMDAAAGFGSSFKAAGLTGDAAADVGNQLAKLGMDMASFGNGTNEEVFTALGAALRGEFDPLERFNVMLNADAVALHAVAMGLAANKNEVSELAKKQATLDLIMAKSIDQQGDLERTAGGTANQWRKLTGDLTNAAVQLAGKLEPALNAVLVAGNSLVGSVGPGIEWLGGVFESFAAGVSEVVATVGVLWRNLGTVWEMTTIKASEMGQNLIAILGVLPDNVGRIAGWIGRNWYNLIADGFFALKAVFTNFTGNLASLAAAVYSFFTDPLSGFEFEWTPLLDGFEATTEKLPEMLRPALVDLSDEIAAKGKEMEDREGARAERIANKLKAAPAKGAAAAKAAEASEKGGQSYDSADFARRLTLSIMGGDDVPKKQLAAAEKTEANTRRTAEAVGRASVARFT
ncbi:hypothetical protein [Paludisphaera mucosa]|uniref:Uncharacterized protein n=1 Tax=Paludisphaera mucosa TaxID=3030827 RepID=A0ABT6F765_9BACT|nr:hypothetical protein [Paludisphaera mucosa]MDG3003253.1 hypothetical protein [Paludisphaera mucosa]